MRSEEFNGLLRIIVMELIEAGWSKTKIGKLLLGEPAQIMTFINNDKEVIKDFGLKPLKRVADLLNYEIRLVVIEKNTTDEKFKEELEQRNIAFMGLLKEALNKFLMEDIPVKINKNSNSSLDKLIDEMIS